MPTSPLSTKESREGCHERGSFAVRDGRLVTGQNPASSVAAAREVLTALQER
ncbi:thiamine biosynthesis protein ThiJ [Hyalangium minutum]|uniref:ThiJ/PfpI family protein n=1 Tax=Hyalangium minutum TaxID=394096 RepID=A0A085WSU8_9BACT|nr:thiamine biosynthesis protein ThiJ [Hyalangium minutum]KFE70761.1 hypothetical protein DB31_5803 [Hyalangium minutum]